MKRIFEWVYFILVAIPLAIFFYIGASIISLIKLKF